MSLNSRPENAALPSVSRPQPLITLEDRSRVIHLPRFARVADNATRATFPDSTGQADRMQHGVAQGLSYRNAAFHVLLNTPIFFNFLRAHYHNIRKDYNGKCYIENCLTCRMTHVAAHYWGIVDMTDPKNQAKFAEAVSVLWETCLQMFWGPRAKTSHKIGPASESDEFYTESFLLHLLATIQRQLEASPAEYQTFMRMFTTQVRHSRKCSSVSCHWVSSSFRWEQSLFLPISVQKPIGKNSHTDILAGLKLAIEREANSFSARNDALNARAKCPICSLPSASKTEIVSFPEVLILVRNIELLGPNDRPDIPLKVELNMKSLGSDGVHYQLWSGSAEFKINPTFTRSVAFARGVRAATAKHWWFLNHDGTSELIPGILNLDEMQRPHIRQNTQELQQGFVFPELFVYARADGRGLETGNLEDMQELVGLGKESPQEFTRVAQDNELIARSVTDVFTQRVGNGLLKFKVQFTPADPEPHDSIPFTLEVGYEHNNCMWYPESKIYNRLLPGPQHARETESEARAKRPYNRYKRRRTGVATPIELTVEQRKLLEAGDGVKPYPATGPSNNAFATQHAQAPAQNDNNQEQMEVDPRNNFNFADNPNVRSFMEAEQNRAAGQAHNQKNNSNRANDWAPRNGNRHDRKRNQKNNHNNNNRGGNNNNNNNGRGGNNNNNGRGGNNNRGGRGGNNNGNFNNRNHQNNN